MQIEPSAEDERGCKTWAIWKPQFLWKKKKKSNNRKIKWVRWLAAWGNLCGSSCSYQTAEKSIWKAFDQMETKHWGGEKNYKYQSARMTENHISLGTSKTFLLSSWYYLRFLCYVKVSFKHKEILCISSLNKLLIKGETENDKLNSFYQ